MTDLEVGLELEVGFWKALSKYKREETLDVSKDACMEIPEQAKHEKLTIIIIRGPTWTCMVELLCSKGPKKLLGAKTSVTGLVN